MNKLKSNWQVIAIVLLLLFGVSKCTQSCNRQAKYDKLNADAGIEFAQLDSVIHTLQDSVNTLNFTIKLYEERMSGMKTTIDIQNEANKRISDAKKNINVTVRQENATE